LAHLKSSHGAKGEEPRKITLQRKTTSTLRVAGSKTISVEVRKKKTFVKRSPEEIEAERQREAEERRAQEEAARLKVEAEERERAEAEARRQAEAAAAAAATTAAAPTEAVAPVVPVDVTEPVVERKKEEPRRVEKRDDDERRDRKHAQHRPSLKEKEKAPAPRIVARTGGEEEDSFRRGGRGKPKLKKRNQHGFQAPAGPIVREVVIGETITVSELAQQMAVKGAEVVKFMFKLGTPVTINQVLDQETAQLVAEELGHKVKLVSDNALEEQLAESLKFEGEAVPRAPVVTVMGHV